MDARTRIIEAAVECLARSGFDGTTISAVAKLAGTSRPTVYAHFGSREQLVAEALKLAAGVVVARITDRARQAGSAAEFVVEATIAARAEFRTLPALAPLAFPERQSFRIVRDGLSPEALDMARAFLGPLVELEPGLVDELDEIAETVIRFLLSLIWLDSEITADEAGLRGYLHRRLVPALGLTPRT